MAALGWGGFFWKEVVFEGFCVFLIGVRMEYAKEKSIKHVEACLYMSVSCSFV